MVRAEQLSNLFPKRCSCAGKGRREDEVSSTNEVRKQLRWFFFPSDNDDCVSHLASPPDSAQAEETMCVWLHLTQLLPVNCRQPLSQLLLTIGKSSWSVQTLCLFTQLTENLLHGNDPQHNNISVYLPLLLQPAVFPGAHVQALLRERVSAEIQLGTVVAASRASTTRMYSL